jgi:hypothetical protein
VNVNYTTSSYPPGGFEDLTGAQIVNIPAGLNCDFNAQYTSPWSNTFRIWVDWNENFVYEASELVYSFNSPSPNSSGSFTVPGGTPQGNYNMRVRAEYAGGLPGPCTQETWGSAVDVTLLVGPPPTCPPPSNLSSSNLSGTTVDLAWTNGGSETAWNIEYGSPGFTPGTGAGTTVAAGSNPYTLSGLTPLTSYDIYLQADCGGGDLSFWIGPLSINTLIAPLNCTSGGANTTLFSTSFENGIPSGWINTAGGPSWQTNSGSTGSSNTGPSGAFTGSQYVYLESSFGATGSADTLYGNTVDLTTALGVARIAFYYHMYGSGMGELKIDISDDGGATWTTEFSQAGQVQTSSNAAWIPGGVDLSAYTGSFVEYRIIGVKGSGFTGDMAIDQFEIETCVSCPTPTNLSASNMTAFTADVSWQLGNTETEWIIEYDTAGFVLGTGNEIFTTNTGLTETLTGLNSITQYDVYIRAICGPGDTSSYSQPFSFTTECATYLAPFVENFDGGMLPLCWENLSDLNSTSANAFWKFTGTPGYGATANGRPVGTYAWNDGSTPTGDSIMLVTPNIDLSPLSEPYLEFDWFSNNTVNPGDNVPLHVDVLSNGVWVNFATLADDSTEWMTQIYDLDTLSGQVVKFRFRSDQNATSGIAFYNDILLDNVKIDNCNPDPGQDGFVNFCRLDDTLNLNTAIVRGQTNGTWVFPTDTNLVVNDSSLVVTILPQGTYEAYYVVKGICSNDTTVATIYLFPPSSAGNDGTLTVCLNEPIDLFSGLSGSIDLGGNWYDAINNLLPNAQPFAPNIPGDYNYDYITSNGVCPNDTAIVEVEVLGTCDWLSVGAEELNDISVYPNPASDVVNIVNPSNTKSLSAEVLDMNGRVVAVSNNLGNTSEGTVSISHLETGMYTLRIYGETGQKMFKIVKK